MKMKKEKLKVGTNDEVIEKSREEVFVTLKDMKF